MGFCWFRISEPEFVALNEGLCISQVSRKSVYCIDSSSIPSFGIALMDENHTVYIWRWPVSLMHCMHWTRPSIASVFDVTYCHGIEHFQMWVRGTWNCWRVGSRSASMLVFDLFDVRQSLRCYWCFLYTLDFFAKALSFLLSRNQGTCSWMMYMMHLHSADPVETTSRWSIYCVVSFTTTKLN